MKILVTDAFCSANRGDAAILEGLLDGLRRRIPGVELTVSSRFPELTRHFHGVDAIADNDVVAVMMAVDAADLVVGCGGSYLHDTYAGNLHPRLATIHACARAGKPFVVFGQSIGPLDSALSRTAARNALSEATWILVRDEASARCVRGLGVDAPVTVGVDCAVSGVGAPQARGTSPVLGVTVRGWHFPGHPDPAGAQAEYEASVAEACRTWVAETGGQVRFLANCTAMGGYAQDDRVAARRVAAKVPGAMVEEREDLAFDVVRGQAAACDLFLGTRMHSLIFATTAGVPSVGIAYEFKTEEWLEQVGLGGRWVPIEAPAGLTAKLMDAWACREGLRTTLSERVPALVAQAEAQLDQLVAIANGVRPSRSARSHGTQGWDQETWRYDRPHRRLRAVVDAVLAERSAGRVLDLGCSSGLLGRMLGPRFDYVGLDVAPSVTCTEPGFAILQAELDGTWPVEGPFDIVVCSGSLEYAQDLDAVLTRARSVLRDGGLAVVTLFNLAHRSRGPGARRHPTWRFAHRPDELLLSLREAGLSPRRVFPSAAGHGPAQAVDAEVPTDLDRRGAVQLSRTELFALAHHLVVVCRADEPAPGPRAVARLAEAGTLAPAVRMAVDVVKACPWSARAWSDLGVLWTMVGDMAQARQCLGRALQLDPTRPGLAEDLQAVSA